MHLQQAGNSLSSSIGDTDLLLASSCDIFSEVLDVTDGTLQFLHQQYHTIHHVRVATDLSRVIGRQINHLMSALDISTGPLARRTFQTAGPVRASTFHLSLARTDHLDICRASRFQIVLARTMTNHSTEYVLFAGVPAPHLGSFCAVILLQRDATVARVGHVNQAH